MTRLDTHATDAATPPSDHSRDGRETALVRRLGAAGAASALLLLALAAPANAHVSVEPSTTAAGASAVLEFSVGHGCDGSSTTGLTIRMPESVHAATPARSPLWEVEEKVVELDPPVTDSHGNEIGERVESVTFTTDEPLPDGVRDTVELSVQIPDSPGTTLAFPVIQTCEAGESAWIEVAGAGVSEDELELPAPSFTITAAEADEGAEADAASDTTTASDAGGDAATTAPASPPGETDALTLAALAAGLLGALLGAAALVQQRRSR